MTNKELQLQLKQFPDDMPVGFFSMYECSQCSGSVDEVDSVCLGHLGDIDHPSQEECIELCSN